MMKKTVILAAIFVVTMVVVAFRIDRDNIHYSPENASGAPAGYSGDPAGGNLNCTSCHSGFEAQTDTGWITSTIPGSGYVPNTTYTISATATRSGITKFGFQVSPQNSYGTFLGTLTSTDSETALTSDPNYITHTSDGTAGSGTKTWTFDWTAPDAGSGDVTFYGAFNLTNNDGRYYDDTIMLSTLTVNESATTFDDISEGERRVMLYPNPACDYITLIANNSILGSTYHITDQAGRQVLTGIIDSENMTLIINQLATGIYYIQIGPQRKQTFQLVKK